MLPCSYELILQVKSVHGDFLVPDARATDNPREVGPVELVLFTTKTYQTDGAAQAIKPLVASNTVILPLQNGVDAADRIGAVVGKEHMLGGVMWLSAAIEDLPTMRESFDLLSMRVNSPKFPPRPVIMRPPLSVMVPVSK